MKPMKENWNALQFDPRDQFANSQDTYIFKENRWFTENETCYLEEIHPDIDVREKLADEGFRRWAFTENPQLPLKPARGWFDKQERISEATDSLMVRYGEGKKMIFGDMRHLIVALDGKKKKYEPT